MKAMDAGIARWSKRKIANEDNESKDSRQRLLRESKRKIDSEGNGSGDSKVVEKRDCFKSNKFQIILQTDIVT